MILWIDRPRAVLGDVEVRLEFSGTTTPGKDFVIPPRRQIIRHGQLGLRVDLYLIDDDEAEGVEQTNAVVSCVRRYDLAALGLPRPATEVPR
jgi:hypothetical protein